MTKPEIIVTVIEGAFKGHQGILLGTLKDRDSEGNVGVQFGKEAERVIGYLSEDKVVIRCRPQDLRVDDDWDIRIKAKRLFGNQFHHLQSLKEPFVAGRECMHDNCYLPTVIRVLVNIWGTVCEVDVCEKHKEYNGKCADTFPWKKKTA